MQRYYKVLQEDGRAKHGPSDFRWQLPRYDHKRKKWVAGAWMPKVDNPVLCERGYHGCTRSQVIDYLNYGLHVYVMEVRGAVIEGKDKIVASEARLVEELPWGADAARFFAVECAADVMHLMKDERSIVVLETAYRFACDDATSEEWVAARDAARDAAWGAARDAARDAAWDAAWGAAWGAARGAARYAARDAAMVLVVRDLINADHYNTLTGPWRTVVGPIHPDDPDVTK